jgi:hypothetical protein
VSVSDLEGMGHTQNGADPVAIEDDETVYVGDRMPRVAHRTRPVGASKLLLENQNLGLDLAKHPPARFTT